LCHIYCSRLKTNKQTNKQTNKTGYLGHDLTLQHYLAGKLKTQTD